MNRKLLILLVVIIFAWYILSVGHCDTNEYLTVCDGDNCDGANKGQIINDRMTDQSVENASLLNARCSADCCDRQWPPPFSTGDTDYVGDFVQSGYTCNNYQDTTGCLCMTRDARNVLGNRGILNGKNNSV